MTKINSRQKGKRIELKAAHWLTASGFPARRGVQFQGGPESSDLCTPTLSCHIEVKGDRSIGPGTKALQLAVEQAERDAKGKPAYVLWWEHRKGWRLSWRDSVGRIVTVATNQEIFITLQMHEIQEAA